MIPLSREVAVQTLGEGFHTSLRKGSDHPESNAAWKAIDTLPGDEWRRVLEFLVDGMASMGVSLTQTMEEGEQAYVVRRAQEMVTADPALSLSDAEEEAVAEWDRKRQAAPPPLLQEIFDGLRARGWTNPTGKSFWEHPKIPGEGFVLEAAIHAQCMIEISEIAEDIKTEFGFTPPAERPPNRPSR